MISGSSDLIFKKESGESVRLKSRFSRKKPVILNLVYYECPTLCNQVLNSLLRALNVLTFDIGTQFDVVTVSIDPEEKPALASAKKVEYLKGYRGDKASLGWHFLTGQQNQIAQLQSQSVFAINLRRNQANICMQVP